MRKIQELRDNLQSIHKKSYPAYKSLAGEYDFGLYILSIDHVQGDPFAAPSHITVRLSQRNAGFPENFRKDKVTITALCDYLLRRFAKEASRYSYMAKGSGKSGVISVTHPGQEVLERSSCMMDDKFIYVRFAVGFPANGRTINSIELSKILLDFLPQCVNKSLIFKNINEKSVEDAVFLAEDQGAVREYIAANGYVAFVADGAVLPRESGTSQLPMKNAVPFSSPESMRISIHLPHRGDITGMAVKKGITMIAGGGYHGKSTLLQALERGVYNHIENDGREFVITDSTALKIRAEDGRLINGVDISLFINNIPNNKSTTSFSTEDASGSTSQAANIMEGIEAGSRVLLIDEDTSATNFMVRDNLMQKIIARDEEPITPFLERAKDLYDKEEISTILVVGSCGSYFYIADSIIHIKNYIPIDITDNVKNIIKQYPSPKTSAGGFKIPEFCRKFKIGSSTRERKNYRGTGKVSERLKIKTYGKDGFSVGNENVNLRYVEQLVDAEQVEMLALLVRHAIENFEGREVYLKDIMSFIDKEINDKGFVCCSNSKYVSAKLAIPRIQEIYAALNRYKF